MGDFSGKINIDNLISYSDDLVEVLKDKKDVNTLMHNLEQSKALQSSCNIDFAQVRSFIPDYQEKIDICKRKIEETQSEVVEDAEIARLQKELEEGLENEKLLKEELRRLTDEINDLDCKRISIEERKGTLKKLEQDELKTQRMLSMYASVTNIIPNLDEKLEVSGYFVDRDNKLVQKFEFHENNTITFNTCNDIWKMMNLQ